ncbi:MAG: ribosome-associated translation inhibitor RaiA [Bacilli bacterium]|jgi:putative sigma-54 modulation protein|nr:ribosome-associated translation inhibitor RaiA [Bacilli bacterium]
MKVIVRGKNKFEPTDAIKEYAQAKMQRMNVYFRRPEELTANVLCKVYDSYQQVEITIPTKHVILRVEVKDQTIYGAIDLAIDKLEGQMRKHKSKIYKSIKQRDGVSHHYAESSDFDLEALQTEIKASNLVKSKSIDLEPMTPEDAIMQMEMLGHDFFVFLNQETGKTCVVYLREDHDYGIIETK